MQLSILLMMVVITTMTLECASAFFVRFISSRISSSSHINIPFRTSFLRYTPTASPASTKMNQITRNVLLPGTHHAAT